MPSATPPDHTAPGPHGQGHHGPDSSGIAKRDSPDWRPSYHLIAPSGWMNDPCAPGFLPSSSTYHVGFQWNPNGAEWGDIVWGKAFSRDLVTWEVSETPSLERDAAYDHAGVFTGCWTPTGPDGSHDKATIIYTSVSRLPIHYTAEYHRGCETLSLATSGDGGHTWVKGEGNPALPGPPEGVDVTGWRDPYVARWPSMSRILARRQEGGGAAAGEGDKLLGIISGGVRNKTPTTWLYEVDGKDLTSWSYVAPLVMPGLSFSPSRWTGDLGVNWEVTNFVSLQDERGHSQDFLIFGAEGCKAPYGGAGVVPGTGRCNRAQLWIAIDAADEQPQDGALTKFSYGGIFDHGLYYAANGFWDPVSQGQVVIGWVTEDDLPAEMQVEQGWSGCLSLPRAVSLATIQHVSGASRSALGQITNITARPEREDNDLYTVQTLRVSPDPRLQKLRTGAVRQDVRGCALGAEGQPHRLPLKTAGWEAYGEFSGVGSCTRVGMTIRHASASAQATVLYFSPEEETFSIGRPDLYRSPSCSTGVISARLQQESAPFTLFTTRDPQTAQEVEERLRIHIFYDKSVLEVFVNERAAITTRVYLDTAECAAVEFFADCDGGAGVMLEEAVVWDGLCNSGHR